MSEVEKDEQLIPEDNTEVTEETVDKTDDTASEASEIDEIKKQLGEEKDKYLRIAAEYDNFRKRSIQDKVNAVADATSRSAIEFLSVIDNFERALNTETTDENYKKGIEMIFRQYTDILKKLGIEEIEALNKPFDPNFHNAVNQIQDENFGENTVCQVFQKGYKMGSKIIRCAMVVVANP